MLYFACIPVGLITFLFIKFRMMYFIGAFGGPHFGMAVEDFGIEKV
jgi:hypothetical protein